MQKTSKTEKRNKKMARIMALSRRVSHVTDVLAECKLHFGKASYDAASQSANDCLVYVKSLFVELSRSEPAEDKMEYLTKHINFHESMMYQYLKEAKSAKR